MKEITTFWRYFAAIIILVMALFVVYSIIDASKFNAERESYKNKSFNGILIEKKDIKHDYFQLRIDTGNDIIYDMNIPGHKALYGYFEIKDSLVKVKDLYRFNIYRKNNSSQYMYCKTIDWVDL